MGKVQVLDHPLLQHKLSILRDKNTGVKEFREIVGEIAALMCYEATRNLPTEEVEIETPVAMAKTKVLSGKKLAIVPILRAGLGMVDSIIELIPSAKVGRCRDFRMALGLIRCLGRFAYLWRRCAAVRLFGCRFCLNTAIQHAYRCFC